MQPVSCESWTWIKEVNETSGRLIKPSVGKSIRQLSTRAMRHSKEIQKLDVNQTGVIPFTNNLQMVQFITELIVDHNQVQGAADLLVEYVLRPELEK